MTDALQLLRTDHNEVKELFKQFEQAEDAKTKHEIARKAMMELEVHAQIEEEIFYPALRKQEDAEKDMMDEADEEHHLAKLLIGELKKMRAGADRFSAKFTVLAESVKHHIDEEESELFPLAAEEGPERLELIGGQMERRKLELKRQMENPRSRPRTKTASRGTPGVKRGRVAARKPSPAKSAGRKTATASRNGASANGRTSASGRTATRRTGSTRAGGARTARTAAIRSTGTASTRAKGAASTRKPLPRAASRNASANGRKAATASRAKAR